MSEQSVFGNESRLNMPNEAMSKVISQVTADIDQFVEGFDIKSVTKRVEEFGKENPVGLALTALTLGVAAGFLMRNSKRFTNF